VDESGSEGKPTATSREHSNEPSGSVKSWEFLEWLSNYWLLRKHSVP
jgi:hypothetical protein